MLSNASATEFDSAGPWRGAAARRVVVAVADALRSSLPQACTLCAAASGNAMLCADCRSRMPVDAAACPRCALPSPDGAPCGRCLADPPPYAATIAAWRYAFPADRLLHSFKYGGYLALAEPLAVALALAVEARADPLPQCLVALPLSRARQRERGFDHAHEIARRVAARTGVPLVRALRRTRDAPPQAGLTLRERARNVRGAFEAAVPLAGLRVAIVDDVMTTGATLAAAAMAARAAGAARVEAWVVARTPPPAQQAGGPVPNDIV